MASNQDDIRDAAIESLHRKRGFKNFLVTYVIINALMIVVWALGGMGAFWPAWVLFGTTIALAYGAWNAYGSGSRPITDTQIDEEMKRIGGNGS